MQNKVSMKNAGYKYGRYNGNGEHVLVDIESGMEEIWFSNKGHASYGITYKNTHLEFARSV